MSASNQNDLRNRILFTIFILAIYRLGTFVPLPGIDPNQLQTLMEGNQKVSSECLMFLQVVLLVEWPSLLLVYYISSSIIVQLLTGVSDYFKNLKQQGERKTENYANYKIWNRTVATVKVMGYQLD